MRAGAGPSRHGEDAHHRQPDRAPARPGTERPRHQPHHQGPAGAARKVAAEAQDHGWIPAQVQAGVALPPSAADIKELYASTETLSARDEAELSRPLPEVKALLSPDEFEKAAQEQHRLSNAQRKYRKELWRAPPAGAAPAASAKVAGKGPKGGEGVARRGPSKPGAAA